jgi:hypothetical protein
MAGNPLTPDEQKKLNDLLKESIRLAEQLGDAVAKASLESFTGSIQDAEKELGKLQKEWKDYTSDIDGTRTGFQNILFEIKGITRGTKAAANAFSDLESINAKLQKHQQGISRLTSKEIKDLQTKAKEKKDELASSGKMIENEIGYLQSKGKLNAEEKKQLQDAQDTLNNINQEASEYNGHLRQLNSQLETAADQTKKVEKAMGFAGSAIKGMADGMRSLGMGSLVDMMELDEVHKHMEQTTNELSKNGEEALGFGGKMKVFGAGLTKMFGNVAKGALDVTFIVTQIVDALKVADNGAGELAKSFNMSYSEANQTRQELGNMAAMSGDVALNTRALQETLMAVGTELGSNAKLNEQDLKTFTKLREQAGYTNEELMGIQKLSLVNGKTLEDNTKEILGGAQAYASRKKLVINEKQVLKEVSKASASLKLSLGGSADALAKAVVQTKAVGLNLDQAGKMAEGLLDFESSIENELSAELMTGKNLNFEKARELALNNDIAGAAEEIANQVGTSADFANMNALQQEAIAKAAGLTKDELAQSLMDREAMAKLSEVEGANAQEKYNNLRKTMTAEEAAAKLGDEQLAKQYEQQSVQERFTQAVEKLKEVFVQIAEPIMAIVSPLMDLVSAVLPAINMLLQPILYVFQAISGVLTGNLENLSGFQVVLGGIAATLAGAYVTYQGIAAVQKVITVLKEKEILAGLKSKAMKMKEFAMDKASAVANIVKTAWSTFAAVPLLGAVLAAAAIAGGVAYLNSTAKANDGVFPAAGGSGHGKRMLLGPEGAIQLNNKDTVIAGTNLFGGSTEKADDMVSSPKGTVQVANSTAPPPPPPDNNAVLAAEMRRGNELREQQLRRDNTVSTLRIQ